MPRNKNKTRNLHDCSIEERAKHSHTCQLFWYEFVAKRWCVDRLTLDVGAGRGDGMEAIRKHGICAGIDPLPMGKRIQKNTLSEFAPANKGRYDFAVAMDVIEHVEEDVAFLNDLLDVAFYEVFFSTPNYNVHGCKNQFHIREYTPAELRNLLSGFSCRFFEADDSRIIKEVHEFELDSTANDFGILINK
jgi:2-polyprenyl-3-methyl-5-hydroxy-6-metoxy-1,4-benzoquinol methylase